MEEQPELWEPLTKYLCLHPKYFHLYQESMEHIFYGDGPLPVPHRHFIAIMGASRHSCQYLIDLHREEFVRLGGDEEWLRKGVDGIPQKLANLDPLNRILAHQPWTLSSHHFNNLLRCPSPHNWSVSELMQGAVILNHVHALCSFVFGCGIVSSQPPSPAAPQTADGAQACNGTSVEDGEVPRLMERMEKLKQAVSETSQEEKAKHFADVNIESSKLASLTVNGVNAISSVCAQFTKDIRFQYTDFAKRSDSSETPTFKIHDFSWEDEGYSLVNHLSTQLSNLLDTKFQSTKTLTYYTMGEHEGVDTTKYRIAIWNYIQSLYGIRHDDYDYAEVNQLITEKMRGSVMTDFQHSEKVHVLLMILEARLQSEFLYFLRSVSRFLTTQL